MRHALAVALLMSCASSSFAQPIGPATIAGKCLLSIYIGFQAARPHCQTSTADLDTAINEAVSILEKRLIEVGEASPEQVQAERDANFAIWQDGGILASQTEAACQSSNPVKWGMTAEAVREVIKAVEAATPETFSDDCL